MSTMRIARHGLDAQGIATVAELFWNLETAPLVEHALRRGLDSAEVSRADFEAALTETRASVTEEMLEDYAKIQDTLKSDAVRPIGGIGFVLPGMLRPRGTGKPE